APAGDPNFGAYLREARVSAGLSLSETAALLGTTVVRLTFVERGVRRITPPSPERDER
nr:helix-turn-helix transcriptional regulator [Gemmatimonadota bacterium]